MIQERAYQDLNKPEEVVERGGDYRIPFQELLSVERGQLFEVMGWVEQEKVRGKNMMATAADLGLALRAWRAYFFAHQAKEKKKNPRATDDEILAILWEKYLDYGGKKKVWRLRAAPFKKGMENVKNRDILSRSISKDNLKWRAERDTEETVLDVIRSTRSDLYGAANGLKRKIEKEEQSRLARLKRKLVREIEEDEGICTEEDFESVMAEIKERVISYLEVDPNEYLGKKKDIKPKKQRASKKKPEFSEEIVEGTKEEQKKEPASQQTLQFES